MWYADCKECIEHYFCITENIIGYKPHIINDIQQHKDCYKGYKI